MGQPETHDGETLTARHEVAWLLVLPLLVLGVLLRHEPYAGLFFVAAACRALATRPSTRSYTVGPDGLTIRHYLKPTRHIAWADMLDVAAGSSAVEIVLNNGPIVVANAWRWQTLAERVEDGLWRWRHREAQPVAPEELGELVGLAPGERVVCAASDWLRWLSPTVIEADETGLLVRRGRRCRRHAWSEVREVSTAPCLRGSFPAYARWIRLRRGLLPVSRGHSNWPRLAQLCEEAVRLRQRGHALPSDEPVPDTALSRMRGDEAEAERGLSVSGEGGADGPA